MSKTRFAKRIMPKGGSMEGGCFKPAYWAGRDAADSLQRAAKEGKFSTVPLYVDSMPQHWKDGFQQRWRELHGKRRVRVSKAAKAKRLKDLTAQQMRVAVEACRSEFGASQVDKYLSDGGDIGFLMERMNASA